MKIYNTQSEIEADIKNGELFVDDDITITFDCTIDAGIIAWDINAEDIKARNITSLNINARNIIARNIKAWDINARDINARNIDAEDINARNIDAEDIKARNIDAEDIKARNINAVSISYYAICVAFHTFTCQKIEGTRENAKHFCLDGDIKILTGERNDR